MRYASWKDRKAIAAGLRPVYTATTVEAAEQALEAFAASAVGSRSPAVVDVWRRAWNEFIPFLDLPADIRRVVYTTNAIESMNYQLRKVTKTRGQFLGRRGRIQAALPRDQPHRGTHHQQRRHTEEPINHATRKRHPRLEERPEPLRHHLPRAPARGHLKNKLPETIYTKDLTAMMGTASGTGLLA